jgi:polyferredoxin
VTLSDGSIRNGYTLKILNMRPEPRTFTIALEDLPGASMWLAGEEANASESLAVEVEADRLREVKVFVGQMRDAVKPGSTGFSFLLSEGGGDSASERTEFFAPEN